MSRIKFPLWVILLVAIIASFFFPSYGHAQTEKYRLCAGSKLDRSSVYSAMALDILKAPELGPKIQVLSQPDSMSAMEALSSKSCDAAFVQGDIGALYYEADPSIREGQHTLFGAHVEAYHWISPPEIKTGFMAKVIPTTVSDLAGLKIAATRSGLVSLRYFSRVTGMAVIPVEVSDAAGIVKAIQDGQAQAGLLVTGTGSDFIRTMPAGLKLLPYKQEMLDALVKKTYVVVKASYAGRTAGPISFSATRAYVVQRRIPTGPLKQVGQSLSAYVRTCLDSIQAASGTHQAWNTVSATSVAVGTQLIDLTAGPSPICSR